jgi:hypothetical protein
LKCIIFLLKWHAPCSLFSICNVEIFKSQQLQPER